jgi:HEAT repeat protein
MRRLVLLSAVLLVTPALAICDLPGPVPTPDPAPEPPPPPPPEPDPFPGGPTTPPGAGPIPGPTTPGAPPTPRPATRPGPRGGAVTGRGGAPSFAGVWHLWWELHREHLLGLRGTVGRDDVVSGEAKGADSREALRARVRESLRGTAMKATDTGVRAAALRALGRVGDDADGELLLKVLRARRQPDEVLEAAAIGLGCLRTIESGALRDEVRRYYDDLVRGRAYLPDGTRQLALMALALRARDDRTLAASLALRCEKGVEGAQEAAATLFACGLTRDPMLFPVVLAAARTGTLGAQRLHDVARSHAALALGLMGDGRAAETLVELLRSRRVQVHTKRSAAMALGLLLRRDDLGGEAREASEKALLKAMRSRDQLVQGFAATGLGTAARPFGIGARRSALHEADAPVQPFAPLALGIAARRLPGDEAAEVQGLLFRELSRARDPQLAAALGIATGLSGAAEAQAHLFARLKREGANPAVRGPAIQGLGLLGRPAREIDAALVAALEDEADEVVEDAAVALGFLGTRATSRLLADKLARTKTESVQSHMVAALSHLGGLAAVEPLLEVLENSSLKPTIRASAASALGILADDRSNDPLFEIDAATNPFALTAASRALVLVY